MMTLQSEEAAQASSSRLLEAEVQDVSPLLFESVEHAAMQETASDSPSPEQVGLMDKLATVEAQLRGQAQALPAQLESVRIQARTEARGEWEQELDQKLAAERSALTRMCDQFAEERKRYFTAVEWQVVKLSLAVAERVLHREATLDPLLLAGVVRMLLEKIQDESETVLRVPATDYKAWMARFDGAKESRVVRIASDEELEDGACVLETNVGTIELGIRVQLAEIERGFFDLLQQRPA